MKKYNDGMLPEASENAVRLAFEGLGPTENEKAQMLERLLEVKAVKRPGLRPLAVAAAGLVLLAVMSAPFLNGWFAPPESGTPGSQGTNVTVSPYLPPAATASPVSSAPPVSEASYLNFPIDNFSDISVESLYQNICVIFTEGDRLVVRQEDYPDAQAVAVSYTGESGLRVYTPQQQFNGSDHSGIQPTFWVELPLSYKGDVSLSSVSGSITAEGNAEWGKINLQTVSGNVTLDIVSGASACAGSVSGSITASLASDFYELGTVSGNITLTCPADNWTATSVSGTVTVNGEEIEKPWESGIDSFFMCGIIDAEDVTALEEKRKELEEKLNELQSFFSASRKDEIARLEEELRKLRKESVDIVAEQKKELNDIAKYYENNGVLPRRIGLSLFGYVCGTGEGWLEISDDEHGGIRIDTSKAEFFPQGETVKEGDLILVILESDAGFVAERVVISAVYAPLTVTMDTP